MTRTVLSIFLAGFLVRAVIVLTMRDVHTMPQGIATADDVEFLALAQNVARGEGFSNHGRLTSFRAPGWPGFVAGLFLLFGESSEVVYLANCLLGGASCVLAFALGRQLLDERGAYYAGWLCVFFVPHAWFATMFYSENLFVPLFATATWVMLCLMTQRSLALALICGLLLGAAVLTRPFALLLVPLWGLLLLDRASLVQSVARVVVFGVGTLAVIAPWTYRNYLVHERLVLVATNGGSTFYGGNNSRVVHELRQWGSWISTVELPGRDEIDATSDEVSHDQVEWRLGQDWIRAHPDEALRTIPLKLARLVFWLPDFDAGKWYLFVRGICWLPYLVLTLAGGWLCLRRPQASGWAVIHLVMLATALTAVIFWGSPRFRDADAPVLMLYPALALSSWRRS